MAADSTRTVRSFCRVCTSVCGILVDVDGDMVTRVRGDREHPLSQGYTCPKGRALPQMHHHPDRIERPQMRIDGRVAGHVVGGLSRRSRRAAPVHHRPSRSRVGGHLLRHRRRHGRHRDPGGRSTARRHRYACQVQSDDHRRHSQAVDLRPGRRIRRPVRPARLRRRRLHDLHRHQPGDLARPRDRRAESHRHRARDRQAWPGVGHRPTTHRDRPTGDRPPRPATRHRPRGAGIPGARNPLRGCRSRRTGARRGATGRPQSSRSRSNTLRRWPTSRPTSWCDCATRCEPPSAWRSRPAPA